MSTLPRSLQKTLAFDQRNLEKTQLPIITVSASYKEDLKGLYNLKENDTLPDVVFSRAHYSMALGVAISAWGDRLDPQKAWIVDPTNYVSHKDWSKIILTENVGKILARFPLLKLIKDVVDKFGRQKLPILASITPPLAHLTEKVHRPILCFHIAAGNILAKQGKTVFQVITDPHVREDYLANAELPNMHFLVFDLATQTEFLNKAEKLGKIVAAERVIVTGPPIDPRIIAARKQKSVWSPARRLRLCLTTGGLGTNKDELAAALNALLPAMQQQHLPLDLMVYASTHRDIQQMVRNLGRKFGVSVQSINPYDPAPFTIHDSLTPAKTPQAHNSPFTVPPLKLLFHPQIVDANELLIRYAFPWADGFVTKPSGDMAYDAAASGTFILTLKEWGEWEHNIRERFEALNISRVADVQHLDLQLAGLMQGMQTTTQHDAANRDEPWVSQAMRNAHKLDSLFLHGAERMIEEVKKK